MGRMITRELHRPFGTTGLNAPPIVFGASALGNVRRVIPDQTKFALVGEWLRHVTTPIFVDVSSKDGNSLALEILGRAIQRFELSPDEIILSARLGWLRMPLNDRKRNRELEAGSRIDRSAVQQISYKGAIASWQETCQLLGDDHAPQLVSIDAPDEFLAAASSPDDRQRRLVELLDAYRALAELKSSGRASGVGISTKDWRVIRELDALIPFDWVMFIGSLTILRHPPDLLDFVATLHRRQVAIVNAGLFNGGFLVGGNQLDGRSITPESDVDKSILAWRKSFAALCQAHGITPAHACLQFGRNVPGITAVAVNSSHPERVAEHAAAIVNDVPAGFWASIKEEGLLDVDYPALVI
jgi:D-threo-aldose 1-dehydrogenase